MKKSWYVLPLVLLLACRQDGGGAATGTGGDKDTASDAGPQQTVTTTADSPITVMFFGTIVQVLQDTKTPRAIVINSVSHPHTSLMMIAEADFEKSPEPYFSCKDGLCIVEIKEQTVLRLLNGTAPLKPNTTATDPGLYKSLVPSLKTIAPGLTGLHADANADMPPKGSVVRAYFDLPSLDLSASPYWRTACYVYPDGTQEGPKQFGREIIVRAAAATPVLQITDGTVSPPDVKTFPLKLGEKVEIAVGNVPANDGTSPVHFAAHFDLAEGDKTKIPTIDPDCKGSVIETAAMTENRVQAASFESLLGRTGQFGVQLGMRLAEVPGCSNTQWP